MLIDSAGERLTAPGARAGAATLARDAGMRAGRPGRRRAAPAEGAVTSATGMRRGAFVCASVGARRDRVVTWRINSSIQIGGI